MGGTAVNKVLFLFRARLHPEIDPPSVEAGARERGEDLGLLVVFVAGSGRIGSRLSSPTPTSAEEYCAIALFYHSRVVSRNKHEGTCLRALAEDPYYGVCIISVQ